MLALSFDDLVAALPMPALVIAGSEEIIALNQHAEKLVGMQVLGRPFITALRQPSVVEAVEACLSGAREAVAEYLGRKQGNDLTYSVTVRAIGETGAVLVLVQDVTHVSAASEMRRDFVANVSHELRTPLTALMGFIETLRGPARDDAAARERFLQTMAGETERMNRLVGDLLSLSRVEANERVRPQTRVDVIAVLGAAIRNLKPIAAEAGVTIVPELPEAGVTLRGDMDQLIQVFTNIIENAIKYGGTDKNVFVSARAVRKASMLRAPGVVISVRDEGAGIAARHLPRLTERFYRADNHRNRALGGTGLGLAIVKHILNRHGGRIKITSKLGQGAEVTVVLPTD
jgi:two-component system phosphate regulon sensor histidine kinase PhoR